MKVNYKLNIDYLKLCYRQPEGLFDTVASSGDYFYGDGYDLLIIDRDDARIQAKVLLPDITGPWSLGTLTLNNSTAFNGKAFFEFDNRALYEVFSEIGNNPTGNYIACIDYIAGDLGLEYNNCTKVDIALDTNVNVLARIKKNIRNHTGLDMFLCRHKVSDANEKLQGYGEYYASTRKRLIRQPEILIGQAKEEGTRLKVYDKSRELAESRPDKSDRYFSWLGEGWDKEKDHIYRVEVSIRNEDLKAIHSKCAGMFVKEMQDMPFLAAVQHEDWLKCYFQEGLESLLYFRDKATGEKVEAF